MIGYKYCKCEAQIPARSKVCKECGYEFQAGEKFSGPKTVSEEDAKLIKFALKFGKNNNELFVHTPSGELPFKFKNDFNQWFYDIIYFGKSKKLFYSPYAIKYFITKEFGFKTEKYNKAIKALNKFIKE